MCAACLTRWNELRSDSARLPAHPGSQSQPGTLEESVITATPHHHQAICEEDGLNHQSAFRLLLGPLPLVSELVPRCPTSPP